MQAITPTGPSRPNSPTPSPSPSRPSSPTPATDQPSLSTLPAELQRNISNSLYDDRLALCSTCRDISHNVLDKQENGNYTDPTRRARQVFFRTKEYREFVESLEVRVDVYSSYLSQQQTIIEGCIQAMLSPTNPNKHAEPMLKQYVNGINNLVLMFFPRNSKTSALIEQHPIYAQCLAVALKHHSSIQTILIEHNLMQNIGLNALIHSLENNTTLQSLSLHNVSITDTYSLSNWLKTNSSLTDLSLMDNPLSAIALIELAQALEINKTLKFLSISQITIPQDAIEPLASTLTHHASLETLVISYTGLDFGLTFLDALTKSTSSLLSNLNLSRTEIMDTEYLENPDFDGLRSRGVVLLIELFKTNTTLQCFQLFDTDIIDLNNNYKQPLTEAWKTYPRESIDLD